MARILIVEDNIELAAALRHNLALDGHEVTIAEDGTRALSFEGLDRTDLIVLDVMLPGQDGFTVLEKLRDRKIDAPVLMLTAKSEEVDKVRAFRSGADQYLTKPFGLMEFLARIDSLLKRRSESPVTIYSFGDVVVDPVARKVMRSGQMVTLTPRSYDVLLELCRRKGAVVSRMELLTKVWGHRAAIITRTVDHHIAELRRKLDDAAQPKHILTEWKIGYRLVD